MSHRSIVSPLPSAGLRNPRWSMSRWTALEPQSLRPAGIASIAGLADMHEGYGVATPVHSPMVAVAPPLFPSAGGIRGSVLDEEVGALKPQLARASML